MSVPDGAVIGAPLRWLRLEGLALLAGTLGCFVAVGEPWWLVPLLLLAPDLSAVGYLAGRRVGATAYNLGHSSLLPGALLLTGLAVDRDLVVALALVWLMHLGMDRAMGYGLKYADDPRHTHLGRHGRTAQVSAEA